MKLTELLHTLKDYKLSGSQNVKIKDIHYDSRLVGKDSLFVALKGVKADGNQYVDEALRRGASVIVTEADINMKGVSIVRVSDARSALAELSSCFFGEPHKKVKLVGITGTNGKTTTSFLIESIMDKAGMNPGVIGTINYRYAGKVMTAPNTTPESYDLHRLLRDMVDAGVKTVIMEVSSHALAQSRISPCILDAAVFTNLTQDHLDYHSTMESYFEAKKRMFISYADKKTAAVINTDDEYGKKLLDAAQGRVITYGTGIDAQVSPVDITLDVHGIKGRIKTPCGAMNIASHLTGRFNLYNILAAVSTCSALDVDTDMIQRGITELVNVPGRLERISEGQAFNVFVDYAHTPDALENVLTTLRRLSNGRIITVFGCGGDRDRGKRPLMGKIAADNSDFVIITSDNPRNEEPLKIMEEIEAGIKDNHSPHRSEITEENRKFMVIPDRREAIRIAAGIANDGDVVLLAGKGHEDYQIIGMERLHFDDREEARKAVRERMIHSARSVQTC